MSIIDTFIYVWQSDTKAFLEGQKKVDDGVDKSVDKFKDMDDATKKTGENFLKLAGQLAGLAAAFMSWQAVKAAAIQGAEDTNKLAAEARSMYLSADELRTWQGAVVSAGGTVEGLNSTLRMLSERTKDPLGALEKVADKFKGLSDRNADKLGKSLGIDASLVQVMQQGTAALQERIRYQMRLGSVTKEQTDIAQKYKLTLADTNVLYDDVRRRMMTMVLPAMIEWEKTMQKVVMWLRDNSTFVFTFFGTVAAVITAKVLPAIVAMGVQWLRTSALFLASPLGIAIAAIVALGAAIALVVDDILAFEEGGKSLIGDIANRWPIIGVIVHNIVDALKMLWEVGRAVFQYLKDVIYEPGKALDNLKARLDAVFSAMEERFPILAGIVKGFAKVIGDFVGAAIDTFERLFNIVAKLWKLLADSPIGKVVGGAVDAVKGLLGSSDEDPKTMARYALPTGPEIEQQRAAVAAGKSAVTSAQNNPLNSTTSNAITNNAISSSKGGDKTVNLNGPVTIEAKGADAATVQQSVGAGLGNEISKAMDNMDDGIAI